jgi:hypothetical protein
VHANMTQSNDKYSEDRFDHTPVANETAKINNGLHSE